MRADLFGPFLFPELFSLFSQVFPKSDDIPHSEINPLVNIITS